MNTQNNEKTENPVKETIKATEDKSKNKMGTTYC